MRLRLAVPLLAFVALSCAVPPTEQEEVVECTDCTPPAPDGGGEDASVATGMPCEVASVLAARCISCHGTTPTSGAPSSLMTRDDLLAPSALGGTVASRCVVRVKEPVASMPPPYTGDTLTPAEVATLEGWVNAGLPGGACQSSLGAGGGSGSAYCRPCSTGADCGDPANFCLGTFCGVDCSSDPTCGANQRCANIINSATREIVGRNCVPDVGQTCSGPDPSVADGGVDAGTGGGTDAGVACTPDTWASYGESFFASTCSGCHPQYSTRPDVVSSRSNITSRINSGSMPQGSTLSSAEKTRILRYLNCGVP